MTEGFTTLPHRKPWLPARRNGSAGRPQGVAISPHRKELAKPVSLLDLRGPFFLSLISQIAQM
jgi:hypothetical protein